PLAGVAAAGRAGALVVTSVTVDAVSCARPRANSAPAAMAPTETTAAAMAPYRINSLRVSGQRANTTSTESAGGGGGVVSGVTASGVAYDGVAEASGARRWRTFFSSPRSSSIDWNRSALAFA